MNKDKESNQSLYKSISYKGRFWVYSEHCYTEAELALRQWIIKVRSNSGIHAELLSNKGSWFNEDNEALINTNENSWFYSNSFTPRQVLNRDDFHVQPVEAQRLQWPALYELMQKTGDYLLLRNQQLPQEHLNQPMNYLLLDAIQMFKALSQNTDINQVREQLDLITSYLRQIEKNISPLVGSDRLFLADCREFIDAKIQPQLMHQIEALSLRERLSDLSKTINKLSTDRNRILHFALNINPVNPHAYGFSKEGDLNLKNHPTQAEKACGQSNQPSAADTPLTLLKLTVAELNDCPNFKLIAMEDEILDHYAKAISDLNELERFQKVITQIMSLLGQAGEVYTVLQFKEQLISLLKQMEGFIDSSSQHIEAIIHANTQAYHQAIQAEQNLPHWKKWLTNEKQKLKNYIKNQDTLAQFPSTTAELVKTNTALKTQVNQVMTQLNQPPGITTSLNAMAAQARALNQLMDLMHSWIKVQHESKGLEPPKAPEPLLFLSAPPVNHSPLFTPGLPLSRPTLTIGNLNRGPLVTENHSFYLGLLGILPLALLAFILIRNKIISSHPLQQAGDEEQPLKQHYTLCEKIEDLIAQIEALPDTFDEALQADYKDSLRSFHRLNKKAREGDFDFIALNEIYQDLQNTYSDLITMEQKNGIV